MRASSLEAAAGAVLSRYPAWCRQGSRTALGNHGGFSGAELWRVEASAGVWCLRAGSPRETWPVVLNRHRLMTMARQHGLTFVPAVLSTSDQATAVEHGGHLWEMTEWMPGSADFYSHPSRAKLEAASSALAQLHTVWGTPPGEVSICPALLRRLQFVKEWQRLLHSGWNPLRESGSDDLISPLVERAWPRLRASLQEIPRRLQRWIKQPHRLQPCLCDIWHDHLLFEGDRLTGLIDYGAIKIDHVAVDLARMLGSLVQNDPSDWRTGLQAYRRFAPLTEREEELAHDLDETGIVIGLANWLRWLYEEKRPFPDRTAVVRRVTELVNRLESLD
jgi:Ser/Thr protein kinase RdoA (MazF antagonist)